MLGRLPVTCKLGLVSPSLMDEIVREIPEEDVSIIRSCHKPVLPVVEIILYFLLSGQFAQKDRP